MGAIIIQVISAFYEA